MKRIPEWERAILIRCVILLVVAGIVIFCKTAWGEYPRQPYPRQMYQPQPQMYPMESSGWRPQMPTVERQAEHLPYPIQQSDTAAQVMTGQQAMYMMIYNQASARENILLQQQIQSFNLQQYLMMQNSNILSRFYAQQMMRNESDMQGVRGSGRRGLFGRR